MNPWVSIWFKPRQTIRQIVDTNPRHLVVPLFVFAGIASWAMQPLAPLVQSGVPMGVAVAIAVGLGGLFSFISLYMHGWLYRWVGSWFGGQAKNMEVRAAIAWVEVPTFALFGFWLVFMWLVPGDAGDDSGAGMRIVIPAVVFAVLSVVVWAWKVILACHTLGEVHRFSAVKGLGTMLIPSMLIAVPIFFLAMFTAILIPNVVRGRISANQTAAIGNLRSLVVSVEHYRAMHNTYPATSDWSQTRVPEPFQTTGRLVDHEVMGHRYSYASDDGQHYTVSAVPLSKDSESYRGGVRSFFVDETGVIRHCRPIGASLAADANDRPIELPPEDC